MIYFHTKLVLLSLVIFLTAPVHALLKPLVSGSCGFNNAQNYALQPKVAVVIHGHTSTAQKTALYNTLLSLVQQKNQEWHATCALITVDTRPNNTQISKTQQEQEIRSQLFAKLQEATGISYLNLQEKITLIVETEESGSLYKLWSAYQEETIIITLKAGDTLVHPQALDALLRPHTTKPGTLLSYGRYTTPVESKTEARMEKKTNGYPIDKTWPESKFRLQLYGKGLPGYPVAFKSQLLKYIKVEDLFYGGNLYTPAVLQGYLYPLYELTRNQAIFIGDTVVDRAPEEHKSRKETLCLQQILKARAYQPLTQALTTQVTTNLNNYITNNYITDDIALLAYSKDRPLQLYALLESVEKHVEGLSSTTVIYYATNASYKKAYQEVAAAYPLVKFVPQQEPTQGAASDFKTVTLREIYTNSSARYILFAVDDLIVKAPVNLKTCVHFLEKTHARAFHLRLGKNITYNYMRNTTAPQPPLYELGEDVLLWKSTDSTGGWHYPYSLDMSLYRAEDIRPALEQLVYQTPNRLEEQWAHSARHPHSNLCFKASKTINVPLNLVQRDLPDNRNMNLYSPEELLTVFNSNLKIALEQWYTLEPTAPHMPLTPVFIERN